MGQVHYEIRNTSGNELVTLNYDRLIDPRETKLSWWFDIGGKIVYLSKNQVEDIREMAKEVVIPRWLVEANGLEGYAT